MSFFLCSQNILLVIACELIFQLALNKLLILKLGDFIFHNYFLNDIRVILFRNIYRRKKDETILISLKVWLEINSLKKYTWKEVLIKEMIEDFKLQRYLTYFNGKDIFKVIISNVTFSNVYFIEFFNDKQIFFANENWCL